MRNRDKQTVGPLHLWTQAIDHRPALPGKARRRDVHREKLRFCVCIVEDICHLHRQLPAACGHIPAPPHPGQWHTTEQVVKNEAPLLYGQVIIIQQALCTTPNMFALFSNAQF